MPRAVRIGNSLYSSSIGVIGVMHNILHGDTTWGTSSCSGAPFLLNLDSIGLKFVTYNSFISSDVNSVKSSSCLHG